MPRMHMTQHPFGSMNVSTAVNRRMPRPLPPRPVMFVLLGLGASIASGCDGSAAEVKPEAPPPSTMASTAPLPPPSSVPVSLTATATADPSGPVPAASSSGPEPSSAPSATALPAGTAAASEGIPCGARQCAAGQKCYKIIVGSGTPMAGPGESISFECRRFPPGGAHACQLTPTGGTCRALVPQAPPNHGGAGEPPDNPMRL